MKVAFLTAGGNAPCLSASIGMLINEYYKINKSIEFIGYLHGYKGLLLGDNTKLAYHNDLSNLCKFGGSVLGNSRVKLTNIKDCINNGYIEDGQIPLEVAANQLIKDKVNVLHTIGGDDTNTTAGDLVSYLKAKKYNLTVVGLPKTIDNDVSPIKQTLGAFTAAEYTSKFFENIVNENTISSRQLIIHEVMGRNCGWLTAYSAYLYRKSLHNKTFVNSLMLDQNRWDIHAVYVPELSFDLDSEVKRLNEVMYDVDCINIFLSEGAGIENIINEMKSNNIEIKYDAFGHPRLDEINPGQWYAKYFSDKLNCDKILVQKSGYFARSAAPNIHDLELIEKSAKFAVDCAQDNISCVVGLGDDNKLSAINFSDIKGGKQFDISSSWFKSLLKDIGQPFSF